ncbi:MAG: hypothetical protein RLZZ126_1202, partial [Pseudomonadota bacterium]
MTDQSREMPFGCEGLNELFSEQGLTNDILSKALAAARQVLI